MQNPPDFCAYAIGICAASVCSSLPIDQVTERLNQEYPTGLDNRWEPSADQRFKGGQPNPCPCNENPSTHKHYLFNC